MKSSTYYFYTKTKILADFLICIIVHSSFENLGGKKWKYKYSKYWLSRSIAHFLFFNHYFSIIENSSARKFSVPYHIRIYHLGIISASCAAQYQIFLHYLPHKNQHNCDWNCETFSEKEYVCFSVKNETSAALVYS